MMSSEAGPSTQPQQAHNASVDSTERMLHEAHNVNHDQPCDQRCNCSEPKDLTWCCDDINSDDLFQRGSNMKDFTYSLYAEENDPCGHLIQSFHGPSWVALREMDREIIQAVKELVHGHRIGDKDAWEHAKTLRKIVPERAAFVASLATLESLQQPSETELKVVLSRYPSGEYEKRQDIRPLTSPKHWKSLRRITRQQKLADALPVLSKLFSRPFRISREDIRDGEGSVMALDEYEQKYISAIVLVLCSVIIGAFVCVPIVILGMDVGSKGDKLVVIVLFIISFGVCAGFWLEDPAIAIAAMLGFAASLVNVSV